MRFFGAFSRVPLYRTEELTAFIPGPQWMVPRTPSRASEPTLSSFHNSASLYAMLADTPLSSCDCGLCPLGESAPVLSGSGLPSGLA